MTTTRDNSTALGHVAGDLFGGGVAPVVRGEVSDREFKLHHRRKDASINERNGFTRVREHWNNTFRNIDGAHRCTDVSVNERAYIRVLRYVARDSDFDYITEPVILQAITAYRKDPIKMKLPRWQPFAKWMCVESIDFYKSKIKVADNKKLHAVQAKAAAVNRAAKARAIATHRFVEIAAWAAKKKLSVLAFLRIPPPAAIASTSPGVLEEREQWLTIAERREQLTRESRESLSSQARTVFAEHFNRTIGARPDDAAILTGIEHALIALYPNDKRLREKS